MHPSSGSPSSLIAAEVAAGNGIGTPAICRKFKVSPPTAFRWIVKGLPDGRGGRVRLEAVRCGQKWLSSQPALERFFAKLQNDATDQHQAAPASTAAPRNRDRTPAEREAAAAEARQQLRDRHGY